MGSFVICGCINRIAVLRVLWLYQSPSSALTVLCLMTTVTRQARAQGWGGAQATSAMHCSERTQTYQVSVRTTMRRVLQTELFSRGLSLSRT